ncbi:dihydroorotate dehydrogenase-like protein [Propionicicella superfundia]|uniref:dihydroorotate dehydrogenase-like protein n=1 Tax=Propionicicella superfundia TaxID=348582 RepID=UPI00041776C8|nr:dihydroorotate dehydrogenase-like protein [Propionicicella superfundia]
MDLTTTYLGLDLANPLVASAGPLTQTLDGIKELADGGVSAIVLHSMFEEVLRKEAARDIELAELYSEMDAESGSFFPMSSVVDKEAGVSTRYLSLIERGAAAVPVPLIASLNGSTTGGWVDFARQMADAGAAAIELNVYFVPGDVVTRGSLVEERHLDILRAVKESVQIPVAIKLSPYFSSFGDMALRLDQAGADGLVLFNRFMVPDIDLERMRVHPHVYLSSAGEGRLPRTWIAALRGRIRGSLAATTGVETHEDVVKYLLAGADVVMTTSALVRNGPAYAEVLLEGMSAWLEARRFPSVAAARGLLAIPADTDATTMLRTGYVAAIERARQTYGSLTH